MIAHSYVARANQPKVLALRQAPGCEALALVSPDRWGSMLYANDDGDGWELLRDRIEMLRPLPVRHFGQREAMTLYPWSELAASVREFRPDVILVEHGSYSAALFQAISLKWAGVTRAKIAYFSWWNLPLSAGKTLGEKTLARWVDGAIFGNQEALELARARGFRAPALVRPLLGEDEAPRTPEEYERARVSLGVSGFVVGCVGRCVHAKGFDLVIRAAAALEPKPTVAILGNGPDLPAFQALAADLGVRVVHRGGLKNHEVRPLAVGFDAWVVPSRSTPEWVEQFGHVLIEAMAWGVPVVGSSSGPIPRVIDDAGLTFQEDNAEELARRLESLLPAAARERMAERGLARLRASFTHQAIANDWCAFLARLGRAGADAPVPQTARPMP